MSDKGMTGMIRLHKWQLDEKRRDMVSLEKMKQEFEQNLADLEEELAAEQKHVAASPVVSIAYAGYAQQVIVRRANIENSIVEIEASIENMKDQVAEAFRELKKYEVVEQRKLDRKKADLNQREQDDLDELSLNIHRRRQQTG